MRSAWKTLAAGALALATLTSSAGAARIALVIGNDSYQNLPSLKKAVADAEAYAALLQAQGFDDVMLHTDLSRAAADEAIAIFVDKIAPGDTAVFAYSGHGWSDGTQNYLVATDAPAGGKQEFLARVSIPLRNGATGVLDDMDRRGAVLKVAIIDACRDNPFTAAGGTRSAGLSRGLSRIEPPNGTFVVFSAGTGQTALDRLSEADADPNSVFTRVFVPLVRSGLSLQEATKEAQAEVTALARTIAHDQRPAYYDEVLGKACLAGTCTTATTAAAPTTPGDDVASAYQAALAQNSVEAWEAFLKYHPDGFYADLARSARRKLAPAVAALPDDPAPPPSDVASGVVTECDRLAAIMLDPDKPVAMRGFANPPSDDAAISACRDAVETYPEVRRFKTQLGFALHGKDEHAEERKWFEEAAAAGHSTAMLGLALLYGEGAGMERDEAEAVRQLERGVAAGDLLALAVLSDAYGTGDFGLTADKAKAQNLREQLLPRLEAAAIAGDPDAPAVLADLYLRGTDTVDADRAGAYLVMGLARQSRVAAQFARNQSDKLSAEDRTAIEQFLADKGQSPGPIDGVIDDETRAALAKWEAGEVRAPVVVASLPPASGASGAATSDKEAGEKALFYEEGDPGSANPGTATWTFDPGGKYGPELKARVEIPDRGLKVLVSIRKNGEPLFPASHIVEINTDPSGDLLGGTVTSVPGLILKPAEEVRGTALVGAVTKIMDGYFWIALSAVEADVATNTALLREGEWIDLPLVNKNGDRAILAFAKGAGGRAAMDEALAAWEVVAKK